jgi:hypothetical protein
LHIACVWSAFGICFELRLPYIESLNEIICFFIRSLEQEGVQFIFGVLGEENLDFIESLNKIIRNKIKGFKANLS